MQIKMIISSVLFPQRQPFLLFFHKDKRDAASEAELSHQSPGKSDGFISCSPALCKNVSTWEAARLLALRHCCGSSYDCPGDF